MQQALEYARILDVPSVFTSNGDSFFFHDKTNQDGEIEKEIGLDDFPTPAQLWKKYKQYKIYKNQEAESIISQDYFQDSSGKSPRYYQEIAINRTVEAIARDQNRILLVMATGTGKTYTAFQIIYRLFKSKKKKESIFGMII